MPDYNDRTVQIENDVKAEHKPGLIFLIRLWRYVFSSAKAMSLIYISLLTLLSLLRPALAMLWGRYIDLAAGYLPGGQILPLILIMALYYLINFLTNIIWRYTSGYEDIERLDLVQVNRFHEKVNSRVFRKLASINPEYWEVPKINDTVDRTMTFMSDKWSGMSKGVMFQGYLVLTKMISVASIAASLYIFNPTLCFIVLAAPLPSLYALMFSQKLRFRFVKENSKVLRRAKYFQDIILRQGAKEVKTMGLFDFFFAKWKNEMDDYTLKEKKLYRNQTLINMSNDFVTSSVNIAATIFAIILMTMGSITIGALGACMSLISTLLGDTKELIAGAATFLTKKNEAALFYDLMELKDKTTEGTTLGEFESAEARDVKYRYPLTDKYVLDGVSLKISKGEKIAFVGENGAGKTTFVKLLTATLSPSGGELYINGEPSSSLSFESRYSGMSVVAQNPARYTTLTIGENIRLGDARKPAVGDEARDAISFAGLEDFDLDTLLGKEVGGTDISGGEWQKIAIARAAYRNRGFIILDEPTSNLDPLAETEVFKRYMELAKDKTVIFVTHRISVAALAERIVVFEDGHIVEDGSHTELLASNGLYARLYNEQSKWYNR
jgi:ATP-binding cassette subfamily B protein